MKRLTLLATLIAALSVLTGCSKKTLPAHYEILPLPDSIAYFPEINPFQLVDGTRILYPRENQKLKRNAEFLEEYIERYTSIDVIPQSDNGGGVDVPHFRLALDPSLPDPEAYVIDIRENEILISASSEAGVFYGVQAVRKMLPLERNINVIFNCATVADRPNFSYRGAMLDVARHFFSVEDVKKYIDILALHQINTFHWHLTDDQGWRIEIPQYPQLTQVGSNRKETVIGKTEKYDGKPYGGYYTLDEAREIVAYAAERYITVIPEIDMPGHMLGALTAYPQYGCTGGPYEVWTHWGVSEDVLCVGNDETIEFVQNILKQILEIFPSEYIHIGGDECPKTRWEQCDICQAKIRELGLKAVPGHTAEQQLQAYFVRTMQQWLSQQGRKLIGWDEIMEGGLADGATVMAWRSKGEGLKAARMGNDVIMVPCSHLYFDYYQTAETEGEPVHIGGFSSVENVYSFEPFDSRLSEEENAHIFGLQGNLWTEYIPDFNMVTYTVLPRMAALSELQWIDPAKKDYDDFLQRLMPLLDLYEAEGYSYATHIFDIKTSVQMDTLSRAVILDFTTMDDADIHYTVDGSEPLETSPVFSDPMKIDHDLHIRAAAFREGERGRIVEKEILFNKATACPIRSLNEIVGGYLFEGPSTLVDGQKGVLNFKTGEWIGFYMNDIDLLIDLKSLQSVSEVSFNTLVEKGAWIFDIKDIDISVSADGVEYIPVYHEDFEVLTEEYPNGVHEHAFRFGATECRYVRIQSALEHVLPDWHPGAGNEAFVFIDEISVK